MNIEVQDRDGIRIAQLDGDFIGGEGSGVIDTISDLLDDESQKGVVVDLGKVPFITSAGLNELVQLTAKANTRQQSLILANPTAYIRGVLEATKLDKFFEIRASIAEAMDALQS